jgi:hypothetical protein
VTSPPENHRTKGTRRARGFVQTGGVLQSRIRKATEKRGFVETRLLTHWAEIAGPDLARIARPVKVGYGREGFGATLTLLVEGAHAPMVQADSQRIRERVNACYGYAAISQIRITQTDASGLAETQKPYAAGPPRQQPDPNVLAKAASETAAIANDDLRTALAALGRNILTRSKS